MKKLIALLLALIMVLSLVACTAKEEPEKEEEKPADSEQKPAEDKKEEKKEEKEEEKEEEPQEEEPVEEPYLPLVKEGEDNVITIGLMNNTKTENYDTNTYTLWLEEQTGIDLQFVYFSADAKEATTQLNMMISGGQELPDILWNMTGVSSALALEYGRDGYFIDTSEYFDEYGYWFNQYYAAADPATQAQIIGLGTDPETGAFYSYPSYTYPSGPACMVYINQNWLDAVGKEVPTNVDDLYDVLKAFAEKDPNGNGEKDEIPLVCLPKGYRADAISFIINAFIYCVDEYMFNVENGTVYLPYTESEYREALIYLNKLYSEGLLAPMTYTMTENSELTAVFTPSDGVALSGVVGAHPTVFAEADNEVLFEYATLFPLEDATGRGGFSTLRGATYGYYNFITSDCENPVLAFKLLDFMASPESGDRMRYGIEGVNFEYAAEGQLNRDGTQARWNLLDDSAYADQGNVTWHSDNRIQISLDGTFNTVYDTSDTSYTGRRNVMSNQSVVDSKNAPHPTEVIYSLVYTDAESELMGEYKTPLMDYVKQARALFITGQLNPNSDDDWNAYLEDLEGLGASDLIAAAQASYDRMQDK